MKNYFTYLPESPHADVWGGSVTGVGYTRIPPNTIYPTLRHPDDHHFASERGRVLQTYQIVLISEGGGTFESDHTDGELPIKPGSVFLLFPGVWHRYSPDLQTGWVEHWLEYRGNSFDRARERALIAPEHPIYLGALTADLTNTFASIHAWAGDDALRHQPLLTTLGIHLLALIAQLATNGRTDSSALLIQRAKLFILERYDESLNMQQLAAELKVGYSHFRQLFKAQTGVSPKQYHLEVRLARARDFLANTDKPLKEIAALLGFHSAFHFSQQFKDANGDSPKEWRAQNANRGVRGAPSQLVG